MQSDRVLLDIGCGANGPRGGHIGVDKCFGLEAFPLDFDDSSVDGIVASHILEHFSHKDVDAVLADWVRVLKPGGVLKIAVPDFESLAKGYLEGKKLPAPIEWVVMGGQSDENDYHKSVFDREHLRARLAKAGLVLLRPWVSEIKDCAEYAISLNIEGTKPAVSELKVSAAMSVPRLCFTDNMNCAFETLVPLGIKLRRQGGAFWGQALTNCMERIIEEDNPDAILVTDYDSVYTISTVARLIELMMAHPEADAIATLQSSRHVDTALFTVMGEDGQAVGRIPLEEFEPDLKDIHTAHFGLTLIRTSKLKTLPKPWFISVPDAEGRWTDDSKKIDEDIYFWKQWKECGNTLFLANHLLCGHMELMCRWPGKDLQVIYQPVREFNSTHKPPDEAWV